MKEFLVVALLLFLQPIETNAASGLSAGPADEGRAIIIGQSYRLASRILGDSRVINVALPEHYNDPNRTFPVIVLLDGGEREDFLHIAGLAQINAAYGNGQEVIVIGVEGVDRRHDLTSPSAIPADRKVAPTSGGATAYRKFLVEDLKPWVAARYRTDGRTALMGESLAGLFVLETFLNEPKDFSDFISVSPSLWWDAGRLAKQAASKLDRMHPGKCRLWIGFEKPAPPASEAAKERFKQRQIELALGSAHQPRMSWSAVHLNETHGTIYHQAALLAFRAVFGSAHQ